MTYAIPAYRIFPLGDTALTVDFGNIINETINNHIIELFDQLRLNPLPGMIEATPSYSSITIYYDVFKISKIVANGQTAFEFISAQLNERLKQPTAENNKGSDLVTIPVCYEAEFAPDIEQLAKTKNISLDEVIRIHSANPYRVYMIGFLPGFSYMGEVDERIAVSRKSQPQPVAAGSIGIAGRQTGIYPSASPGGWQIIGRTPLKLFDAKKEEPALLKPGDIVQFTSISKNEFENY